MAWQAKVAGVIGTAVLSIGFYATDAIHKIENNPTALFMAGQFWVMAGERDCGLELIERASRASHRNDSQATTVRPSEAAPQMCSREPVQQQPRVVPAPKNAAQPRMLSANVSAPQQSLLVLAAAAPPDLPPGYENLANVQVPAPAAFAGQYADLKDFVAARMLVVSDGKHVIDPAFEQRMKKVELEAQRTAHRQMQFMNKKALREQVRFQVQRG